MATFADKLRQYRISNKMSLDELAEKLSTSKQVLSRYENGIRIPKITTVQDYAMSLGVPLVDLLPDDENPNVQSLPPIPDEPEIRYIARKMEQMDPSDKEMLMRMVKAAFDDDRENDRKDLKGFEDLM